MVKARKGKPDMRFRIPKRAVAKKATKALAIAKENKKFIQKTIEMKQVNYNSGALSISSAGLTAGSFTQTATGAEDGDALGSQSRIGNSITLLRQQCCMNIQADAVDTYNQFRVLIVESMDGNQPLLLTDVLQYGAYSVYGSLVFASPYTTKTSTNKRYKVHYDKTFELSALPTKGGKASRVIKHTIKYGKSGKELEYAGAGSLNPNNHRLTLMWISDSVSGPHPALHYSVRSSYKDA